jgi:glutamate synthase domain-containing protein 1
VDLPAFGEYAVGNVFTGKSEQSLAETKAVLKRLTKERGFKLIGIRTVPTNNADLGASALATEPAILQVRGLREGRDFGWEGGDRRRGRGGAGETGRTLLVVRAH